MHKLDNAIQLVEDGNVEEGLKVLKQLREYSNDDEKYTIAEHYFKWGFVEDAKEIVEELMSRYPDEGELFVFLAEILIDLDMEEKAIDILEQIAEDDPVYLESLVLQADLFQMQGLFEVSEQKLLLAKEKSDDETIIDFALAELYSSHGEYNKSIPYYEKVLQNGDEIAGVNVNARIAESYSTTGKFEEALPYYEDAIKKQEDSNTLFGFGVTAYQAKYYKKAIEILERLKELDPDYSSLYLYLAKAYEEEANFTESFKVLLEGLEVESLNKELTFYAGKISMLLGDKENTEKYLRAAVGIDPGYVEATLQLSKFLLREERFEDVVECLESVMSYGEYDEQFEWDLGFAKNKLEQYSDALNHYRHAYTSFKETPEFLEEFGYFLLEDGKRQEAVEVFKELLKLDPMKYEIEALISELE
ncbi:tetratricopeptide repeat protein [Fredinandcohnia sp. QZ13]|uniref:tetratricopeptide repeat protein n=1 Tax=Fredinandcohnia sp. QZ13 TaxID=3073144 RepID=UPI00285355DF|nr:tetratricopeptide repeat protein [Fredinandcohnia sp. QZ13]MDR4888704.1 tetratricopeptide repeat protein [Fredinandcohnia sp. QZ13]